LRTDRAPDGTNGAIVFLAHAGQTATGNIANCAAERRGNLASMVEESVKQKEAARYASNAPLLKSVARLPKVEHRVGGMHDKSVRTFTYKGHEISITTMYQIKIDRRVVHLPLLVSQDGHVQSHAIPNYSQASAVDIVKAIIDQFPADFEKKSRRRGRAGGQHGGHSERHHN
jgi:hypothetical protein